jgi:hypothetical protein
MNLMIHEILDAVVKAPTREAKAEILKKNDCLGLRDVLRGAFDDFIVWELPKGSPPIQSKLSKEGMPPSDLKRRTTELAYFCAKGPGVNIRPDRRERMWLALLEGIHPKDAEVLVAMKDKKLHRKYSTVSKTLVQMVWPQDRQECSSRSSGRGGRSARGRIIFESKTCFYIMLVLTLVNEANDHTTTGPA